LNVAGVFLRVLYFPPVSKRKLLLGVRVILF